MWRSGNVSYLTICVDKMWWCEVNDDKVDMWQLSSYNYLAICDG